MEELDGDVVRLSSRGRYAERDIVQVRGALVFSNYASRFSIQDDGRLKKIYFCVILVPKIRLPSRARYDML